MKLSLIVPCFNEQESLPIFYKEVMKVIKGLKCRYEIIFIDDGSADKTLEILKELANKNENIFFISFSRNFGKEAAMYAGLCNATGDYVAVMDADMQDPPELLPQMLQILETEEYASVATRRITRKGEPVIRSFFARMFYKLINKISDADIVDGARDFRLMKRKMVDTIVDMGEYNRFSKGIFGWIGYRTYWLSYENVNRIAGETKWSFWKLFKYAIDGVINFSQVPLNLALWSGLFITIISFLTILLILLQKFLNGGLVLGWEVMMCVIALIGGIQLCCIGIMGQYIAKTYSEVKNRPHYIVDESNLNDMDKVK